MIKWCSIEGHVCIEYGWTPSNGVLEVCQWHHHSISANKSECHDKALWWRYSWHWCKGCEWLMFCYHGVIHEQKFSWGLSVHVFVCGECNRVKTCLIVIVHSHAIKCIKHAKVLCAMTNMFKLNDTFVCCYYFYHTWAESCRILSNGFLSGKSQIQRWRKSWKAQEACWEEHQFHIVFPIKHHWRQ